MLCSFIIISVTWTDLTGQSEDLEVFMFRLVYRCQNATTGIFHQTDGKHFLLQICEYGFPPILRSGQSMPSLSLPLLFSFILALSDKSMQGEHFNGLKGAENLQTLPDQGYMLIVTFIAHSACASCLSL